VVQTGAHTFEVFASHTFNESGVFDASVAIAASDGFKAKTIFQTTVADAKVEAAASTAQVWEGGNHSDKAKGSESVLSWGDGAKFRDTIEALDGFFALLGRSDN
jgi:hypothetical protein